MAKSDKANGITTKHQLIEKASTQVFATVAVASIIVSMSLVLLNIMWGTAQFNDRVHDKQEAARDTLEENLTRVGPLAESFNRLEIGQDLLTEQPDDKSNSEVVLDALPTVYDFPELATAMNNLAGFADVRLLAFSGEDISESAVDTAVSPEPVPITISVEVSGNYAGINRFLEGVERSIRPISVVSVEMSGVSERLETTIILNTYYQPAVDLTIQKETVR